MTTRLDRLILLLDKGTSSATRNSAAQQIGEILRNHPHELHNLISRVQCLLKSKSWETRGAAAMTISEMVKNVPQWDDTDVQGGDDPMDARTAKHEADGRLGFETFDIRRVLDRGHALLGSSGKEYDYKKDEKTSKEKLEQQKNHLISMLDLQSSAGDLDIDVDDLEDNVEKKEEVKVEDTKAANEIADKLQGLSARERLRMKRLAKGKRSATLKAKLSKTSKTPKMRIDKAEAVETALAGGNVGTDLTETTEVVEVNPNEWPFEHLCDELRHDLFDAEWEVRHGAGSALRDIINIHGHGGGKVKGAGPQQNAENHNRWLEDIAIRLLCIFALDKFSDFGSDQAVAPVRETCAQSLGALLPYMDAALVTRVLSELLHLLEQDKWEVRHGGLLGVKYILAVRADLAEQLLPTVLPAILSGLIDDDDDVRAVAAEAARPIVDIICAHEASQVPELLNILWDTLSDLDDLTASTSSVLSLLAELLSHKDVMRINERDPDALTSLVPKLFPFLRHSTTAVRKATLRCLSMVIGKVTPTADLEPGTTPPTQQWLVPILSLVVKHLFQNMLLEEKPAITELNNEVWGTVLALIPNDKIHAVTQPHIQQWLTLLVTPMGGNFNEAFLILPPKARIDRKTKLKGKKKAAAAKAGAALPDVSRGPRMPLDPCEATRLRLCACRALAEVALKWPGEESAVLIQALQQMVDSNSNVQRIVAATILSDWMDLWAHTEGVARMPEDARESLITTLHAKLTDTYVVPFVELEVLRQRLREDASALVHSFLARKDSRVQCEEAGDPMVYNEDMAMHLCTTLFDKWSRILGDTEDDRQTEGSSAAVCRSKQMRLLSCVGQLQEHINVLTTASMAALSECCVIIKALPPKLNPIIRPLMDSIKTELDPLLQERSAKAIAALFDIVRTRTPCPIPKITKNLCASACADVKVVPIVSTPSAAELDKDDPENTEHRFSDIYTLQLKTYEANAHPGPGRKPKQIAATVIDDDVKLMRAQANGGRLALQQVTKYSADHLMTTLPNFWPQITESVVTGLVLGYKELPIEDASVQPLVNGLYATKLVIPALHPTYHPRVLELMPYLIRGLGHPYKAVRYMCAHTVAVVCQTVGMDAIIMVISDLLPLVNHRTDIPVRQGSVEAIYCIIELLGLDVLTYLVFFMAPVLSRMTDQNMNVRQLASFCFAALLRMMPLEAGAADPPGLPEPLKRQKLKQREFLELLADSSKITDVPKPMSINADLRPYQQEGFNWLCFLRQYGLHGVLGDDMGLGKTLQAICLLVYDNEQQRIIHEANQEEAVLPHLVICPSTLVAHWFFEIEKFTPALNPMMYYGTPAERKILQSRYQAHDVIIVSYDVMRNDSDWFETVHFSYCILDEGHIIKNLKAKITKAAKSLHAEHRLILSGTPIQNNVVELWSLFDFLMPGFLSTDRVFQETYSKPIMASRDAKTTAKEAEAGAAALEALHRQMLPFMMRRVKEDVLKDLPPKIIQDLYCDLSMLQKELYDDFQNSSVKTEVEAEAKHLFVETVASAGGDDNERKRRRPEKQSAHVFQALQYLRKLCTHPALVLSPTHPQWKELAKRKLNLNDIVHAPKLIVLKQLLLDCGIGNSTDDVDNGAVTDGGVSSNHRVLIFCQHKAMLDLIEEDLFKPLMPKIIYLRMDGNVDPVSRFAIVSKFNADPTIDVLLLTTHVGGLGLNLTGADTVVFVEHDWNPMKDLQAMDRAHRIGQKKVVSVYRLITKNTLEEKVMGLQKFKLNIANSVITSENASMRSMDTTQLLDLFNTDEQEKKTENNSASTGKVTIANAAGQLEELWDENQYDDEYDMNSFLASLKKD